MPNVAPPGALSGVRILDFSVWRPGPYATQLLGEVGADVLKIEPPGGDPMRTYPDLFARLNVNKRSVVLDLKDPEQRARALELGTEADVVVEGFRPGVVSRLGVDYPALRGVNESIIYCSVSGLGQDGALSQVSGHDLNYLAWSGALSPNGGPPVANPLPIADLGGGIAAAFAISAALFRRLKSGEGEYLDVAMADVLATWADGALPDAGDGPSQSVPGYGIFETADGKHLTLGVVSEGHFWAPLCDALGLKSVAGVEFTERKRRAAELQALVATSIKQRDLAPLLETLLALGVPVVPVLDRSEMLGLAHFKERSVVIEPPDPSGRTGHPVRFAAHPASWRAPAPGLDEHRGSGFGPRNG